MMTTISTRACQLPQRYQPILQRRRTYSQLYHMRTPILSAAPRAGCQQRFNTSQVTASRTIASPCSMRPLLIRCSLMRPFTTASAACSSHPQEPRSPANDAPAGGWFGLLSDQSVIRITAGSPTAPATELLKYLHNLMTADMYSCVSEQACEGYTMFLNSKGRVLFDGLFVPINASSTQWMADAVEQKPHTTKGPAGVARAGTQAAPATQPKPVIPSNEPRGIYLTVTKDVLPLALAHLSQYNLRRKVTITDMSNQIDVHQVIPFQIVEEMKRSNRASLSPPASPAGLGPTRKEDLKKLFGLSTDEELSRSIGLSATIDPRCKEMGIRILTPTGSSPQLPSSFKHIPVASAPAFFHSYRILNGISTAPLELIPDKSLPLEHGLHEHHGVSFTKGCYLGQELTARTFFQGAIRKKVWPNFVRPIEDRQIEQKVKPIQEWMQGTSTPHTASSSSTKPVDPFLLELQQYFPFFDPTFPTLPTETPVMRESISPSSASDSLPSKPDPILSGVANTTTTTASKSVAQLLSTSHNLALAMLRTEHLYQDETHALLIHPTTGEEFKGTLQLVPYQPPSQIETINDATVTK